MSKPDYRYLQAWARPSAASRQPRPYENRTTYEVILPTTDGDTATPAQPEASKEAAATQSGYQVRLDTPGGFTYAPDILAQHNSAKRLFIPGSVLEQHSSEYDFAKEIRDRSQAAITPSNKLAEQLSDTTGSDGKTAAETYKDSVRDRPFKAVDNAQPFDIPESATSTSNAAPQDRSDNASILTHATTASVQTTLTAMTLAAGPSQTLPRNVMANAVVAPFHAPPAISGDKPNAQTPWKSNLNWTSHRAFDRPTDKERAAGISQFEEATEGRVPSAYEASIFTSDSGATDNASIRTEKPRQMLTVQDLFVPDPRPWRPLRWVRKIDPRQMLILSAGAALTSGQVAAATYGKDSALGGGMPFDATMLGAGVPLDYKALEAQLKTSGSTLASDTEEKRIGLGFVFCPSHDPRCSKSLASRKIAPELNFSRRLEHPPEFMNATLRRGALRAALAALEFTRWEAEGFDKIVIGTHHTWLVDGISRWIWEWRKTSWRLNGESPLGMVGDQVPDRDLWELLDRAVKSYEEIDCTVRFWKITKEQNAVAVEYAKQGACKETVHPGTVRWTKKNNPSAP